METIRLGVDALGPAEGPNSLPTELSQGANKNYQTALEIEARPYLFMNNEADAIPFYEKARDEGVMEAALRLGRIHESHIDDFFTFGKDPRSSAIENYEIAAQSQDTEIRNSAFSAIERLKSDEYSAKKESLRQMAFGLERATLERLSLNNPSQVAKPFGFHDKL